MYKPSYLCYYTYMTFEHNIYDFDFNDLLCETKETGRTYATPKGAKYPSITTVLGILSEDAIKAWRKRVGYEEANRISRQAAARGSKTHDALELFVKNIEPTLETPLINYLYKQIAYILEENLTEVNGIEQALYSNHLGVAGRVDLVGVFNGKRSIIDFKTSSKPKKKAFCESYFCQETFYAIAWEELTGQPITQLVTIIANEEGPQPQIFVEHRDTWAPKLIETIKMYKDRKANDQGSAE